MKENTETLQSLIEEFLSGKLDGARFEREFTDVLDFEEIQADESLTNYFSLIRELLERFTTNEEDLKKHPDYYINSRQLKEGILKIKEK